MSTYASKQQKSQSLMDTIWVLAYIVIIAILLFSGFNTNMQVDTLSQALGSQRHVSVHAPIRTDVTFASDESYWRVHCINGWMENATCDSIVIRAQSCEFGNFSTYCSNYKNYLFRHRTK